MLSGFYSALFIFTLFKNKKTHLHSFLNDTIFQKTHYTKNEVRNRIFTDMHSILLCFNYFYVQSKLTKIQRLINQYKTYTSLDHDLFILSRQQR